MGDGGVKITVTRRIPMLLVVIGAFRAGKKRFFEDTRVATLVESNDAELLIGVFFDDTEGVLVSVKRGHKNKRHVNAVFSVKMLL